MCLALTKAISNSRTVEEIYEVALDALEQGLQVSRASIQLFDPDGVMRFKAFRGVSQAYRLAVAGYTPWKADSTDVDAIVVEDVTREPSLLPYLPAIRADGIAALSFIPLVHRGAVIGKFMLYSEVPRRLTLDELQLAGVIASQVAFAVARTRAEDQARRSEEHLRFALDAASMGTWDWDLVTQRVTWSDNLERLHGLPSGTFDGTFASYEREIHPDDRPGVLASAQRAITDGVPHDVEYRIVAPDGTVRWVEGKGRVEMSDGKPHSMSGVCIMATRRKEAELARLAASEETGRLKDEFLATLSHELRTPLNAILGWVQMLEAGSVGSDRLPHALQIIGRNATLQAQLIEDILDISRIISGKLEIERGTMLVAPLIDTAIGGVLPLAELKRIQLTKSVPDRLPEIEGDRKRLHQVLGNVMSNAVKFTPQGGRVDVRCAADGEWVTIEVRDSGVGIDPAFTPFVFDRFRQGDSRSTRRHGGLGLGLAIARHLVEQHRGDIQVQSEGLGRGTTLTVRLPIRSNVPVATAPPHGAPAHHVTQETGLDGVTVLVVDDQLDSRDLLDVLLSAHGARVLQAASAAAALAVLERESVNLLVADIAMPDTDGYELVRRVRVRHPKLPAVAVSAYARPEDRRSAINAGYDAACAKPIETTKLLRTIRELLTT